MNSEILNTATLRLRFDARHPALVIVPGLAFGSVVVGVAAGRGLLAGLVALAAVAATLWAVSHPTAGAIAIVAVVPAISGIRRGLPVPGLRLGELLAVGFGVMLLATVRGGARTRWRTFDWLALGYVVATFALGMLGSELRGDTLSVNDIGQLVGPLQFFLLYRAVLVALPNIADRARAVDWLLIASVPVSLITLLQTARVPGVNALLVTYTGMDYSDRETWAVFRANGPFAHHTTLAAYLMVILVICAALLLAGVNERRRRLVFVALVPAALAMVTALTFAPMVAVVVGALGLAFWYRRTGRVLTYGAIACALLAIAFQPLLARRADDQFKSHASSSASYSLVPQTVTDRLSVWTDQYLPVLQGRWLTGYGPQIPPEITWKFTESVYLTMLLRGGLPLLALYAALMWALALVALDVGRRPKAEREEGEIERALARALFVVILILAVIQTIAPLFTANGLPQVWWIMAALVVGAGTARA